MSRDLVKEGLDMQEVMSRIRALAKRLIERDVPPADVSFALAYIGAELGMLVSNDPARVFPVVLDGLSQAATNYSEAKRTNGNADEGQDGPPAGTSIH